MKLPVRFGGLVTCLAAGVMIASAGAQAQNWKLPISVVWQRNCYGEVGATAPVDSEAGGSTVVGSTGGVYVEDGGS